MYEVFRRGAQGEPISRVDVAEIEPEFKNAVGNDAYDVIANLATRPYWIWKRASGFEPVVPEPKPAQALANILTAGTEIDATLAYGDPDFGSPEKAISGARKMLDWPCGKEWALIQTRRKDEKRGRPETRFHFKPQPATTFCIAIRARERIQRAVVLGDPNHPDAVWQEDTNAGLRIRQVIGLLDWTSGTVEISLTFAAGPKPVGIAAAWLITPTGQLPMADRSPAILVPPQLPPDGVVLPPYACLAERSLIFETGSAFSKAAFHSLKAGRADGVTPQIQTELHLFLNGEGLADGYRTAILVALTLHPQTQ